MDLNLDLRLPPGPMAAAYSRTLVAGIRDHVPNDVTDDVRLLVSELVTNCVRHGSKNEDIRLRVTASPERIRFEVWDDGEGFEPVKPSLSQGQVGGWGLYLVEQLSDRWGVTLVDGCRVWFEIDLDDTSRANVRARRLQEVG